MSTRPKRSQRPVRRRSREANSSVVSLRIDNELRELLQQSARGRHRTLSAVLREALDLWLARSEAAAAESFATAAGGTDSAEICAHQTASLRRQPSRPTPNRI